MMIKIFIGGAAVCARGRLSGWPEKFTNKDVELYLKIL